MPLPPSIPAAARAPQAEREGWDALALPLLTAGEEPVLGFWIEAGVLAAEALTVPAEPGRRRGLEETRALGERALERMARSNIRLVYHWITRSWSGRDTGGLDVEDLAAVGIEGLIHAIWRWDYRRGLKFSTYASWWIRQYLDRAVVKARGLRPGTLDTSRLDELFQARATLEVRLGRSVTVRELSAALQISPAAVQDLQLLERNVRAMVRLDAPLSVDGAATVGDLLIHPGPAPEQVVEDAELRDQLTAALTQLTARERNVLTARVGWAGPVLSEDDVAARFGVTPAQVRATTESALARLRVLVGQDLPAAAAA
jgi:RNA polymerase primary sigma factor